MKLGKCKSKLFSIFRAKNHKFIRLGRFAIELYFNKRERAYKSIQIKLIAFDKSKK